MTCPICIEEIREDSKELSCKHVFHTKCITEWLKKAHTCPTCRHQETQPKSNTEPIVSIFRIVPPVREPPIRVDRKILEERYKQMLERLSRSRVNTTT
jgi:hypothetical protein